MSLHTIRNYWQKLKKEKEDLKAKVEKWHNSSKNLSLLQNSQMSANDKFRLGYGDHRYDGILSYENEVLQSVFMNKESDLENQPLYDRFVTAEGMHVTQTSESETQTSDFDTCESDCSVETHESLPEPAVNEPKVVNQPKVWSDAPIIEEYESDSEDEHVSLPTEKYETPSFANQEVKTPRETVKNQFTYNKNPKVDNKGLGYGFTTKQCFVCMRKKSSQKEIRPIWNNVQRVNHKKQFVPTTVLTRTGKIPVNTARASGINNVSIARHNFNSQAVLTNAARKISTVKPFVNRVRPKTVFHKTHSPFRRPFNNTTALRTNFSKQKVNTAEDYPHRTFQNKGIVDSGCSRHMTGNKAYLAEYQDFNGGPIAFGGSKGYITGKGPTWLFDLDYLTDSIKYQPVRSENLANKHAGPQEANQNAGTKENINSVEALRKEFGLTKLRICFYKQELLKLALIHNDSEIPALEEIYANPTDGIFTNSSYDDEGVVADFTNLEPVMNVSPIPSSRINSIHPSSLILGDPQSAVQTRSKVTKSSGAYAFEECLQFKFRESGVLVVICLMGRRQLEQNRVYRNKKDERGVVVRNKARLVAQGHRQEEGIYYDEVFAPVAQIEAIRIFLAFPSYMRFIVY
ncbi:copia protein [Tanacetum coccineum]